MTLDLERRPAPARRTRHRVLSVLALVLIAGAAAACSSDDPKSARAQAGATDTTEAKVPVAIDGPKARNGEDAARLWNAYVKSTYDRFPDEADWYKGGGYSGTELSVIAEAADAGEATQYCDLIAPAAEWFFGEFDYTLEIEGVVVAADGNFEDADFEPVACAATPPPADPVVSTAPEDPDDAVARGRVFVEEYFDNGFDEDGWFGSVSYTGLPGKGALFEIDVTDGTDAAGTHCADIVPIMAWVARDRDGAPAEYDLKVGDVTCPLPGGVTDE